MQDKDEECAKEEEACLDRKEKKLQDEGKVCAKEVISHIVSTSAIFWF